jgi:hypothetical protein
METTNVMMKSILTTIAFFALAVSGLAQTRSVIVNTGGVVQSPTNFWSADVTNARSGLGLGTAATNPASAFQPSSSVLTNLANNNGSSLTNISASGVVGILTTNGNGAGLTNLTAANITGTVALASNVTGIVALANGGTGGTNAATARAGLGATTAGSSMFTLINPSAIRFLRLNNDNTMSALSDSDFRTAIGLGTAATNPATAFQPSSLALSNLASSNGGALTNLTAANITGAVAITNGGSGATTAGGARTNLGGTAVGNSVFTAINAAAAATAIGLGTTSEVTFSTVSSTFVATTSGLDGTAVAPTGIQFNGVAAATTRTNLGLPLAALTNTNTSGFNTSLYGSGTNPVLYNTNGEVVSPTNFWQVAPIVTRFVEFDPSTNATTNIVAARNLHIHSLAISRTGVTSTIALPTTNSFNGDIALVVHEGPTSSVTQVRTQGSTNNLVTMNRTEEAVEFVYYNSVWQFNHNRSFVEPIYFSGTNAAVNAAASRTNLGLGNSSSPEFASLLLSGLANTNSVDYAVFVDDTGSFYSTYVGAARTNLGLGATNDVTFSTLTLSSDLTLGSGDNIVLSTTNGTKIGTATNQLLGFYNKTPITQPSSTGVTTNGFTTGSVSNVHANSTFTGGIGTNAYTISDVVAHLKSLGLLAP